MSKAIVVVGLMLSVVLTCTSVSTAQNRIKFGILSGLNIANMDIEKLPAPLTEDFQKTRLGFGGGAFAELALSEAVFLDLRAMYLQKGMKLEGSVILDMEGSPVRVDFRVDNLVNYLSIPALLKVKLGNSGVKPCLFAGPDLGFKLSAKSEVEVNGVKEEDEEFEDDLESLDFALDFGGGLEFPAANVTFFVQGLYSLGLTDIAKETNEEDDPGKVTTRGIIILAGIRF